MFKEFENQIFLPGPDTEVVANTDTSIDGSSSKITFKNVGDSVELVFDPVDVSEYQELTMHFIVQANLKPDLFTMDVGGKSFDFKRDDFIRGRWCHIIVDCSDMGTISQIKFTSKAQALTIFFDYPGYRRVDYTCDMDVIKALKSYINLDYKVQTTLSEDAFVGDTSIVLDKNDIYGYVMGRSRIELNDMKGMTQIVNLIDISGEIEEELIYDFPAGSIARVICPVLSEEMDSSEPDPMCGIVVYDKKTEKQRTSQSGKDYSPVKEYLGSLGLVIYVDCGSKKKVLQLAREYDKKYGAEFQFLLDGEQVEIYMENSIFADDELGNNARMAYYYLFEPQPYLLARGNKIDDFQMNMTSIKS